MRGIASSSPTEGDLHFFPFTQISFKTFHGFAWFLKSKTIYIHRTYIHTSIIYVTKKVIHWGANHPNPQCVCGGLGGEPEKIEKKFRSRTVNVFEKWFQR